MLNRYFFKCFSAFVALFLIGSASVWADNVKIGDLVYVVDKDALIAAVARDASYATLTEVTVPATITVDGAELDVTKISQQAFQECKSLAKINIGQKVETIEKWAFYGCTGLREVVLPQSLTTIMASAFSGCSTLEIVEFPDNLTSIADYAFGTCVGLKEITLPKNMTALNGYAFSNCSGLAKVNFNDQLVEIGNNAFYACGIVDLSLPASLQKIGTGAFSNNTKLVKVIFPTSLNAIGDQAFFKCSSLTDISWPSDLESIGMGTFYECSQLSQLDLPSTLTSFGSNAFYGCEKLESVVIPAKVTALSSGLFYNCTGLKSVTLHRNIKSIGGSAFYNCSKLESIDLPDGLTSIESSLFSDCVKLAEVKIPGSVTEIKNNAFYNCKSLTSLDISANVSAIGNAFALGCSKLQAFNVDAANTSFRGIDGVLFDATAATLIAYPGGKSGVYTVPSGVAKIQNYAFNSCTAITGILFPEGLKSIGMSAFYGCSGLKTLALPESIDSVNSMAFFMARSIESVRLPNHQAYIGNNAFSANALSSLVIPEGFTTFGIEEEATYSIMSSCAPLKSISLPSTLTEFSPVGSGCSNLKGIYSFAKEAPMLQGQYPVTVSSTVYVPVGSAGDYREKWAELYPNMNFVDTLPLPEAAMMVDATGQTKLQWEAFSDGVYQGTPVRYEVAVHNGTDLVVRRDFEVEPTTQTETIGVDLGGLTAGDYRYAISGFASTGELTISLSGEFSLTEAAVGDLSWDEANVVERIRYDLMGREINRQPRNGEIVIEISTLSDGTKKIEKLVF